LVTLKSANGNATGLDVIEEPRSAGMVIQTHSVWRNFVTTGAESVLEHHHFEHFERNHQGKGNFLLFPSPDEPLTSKRGTVRCRNDSVACLSFTPEPLDSLTTRVVSISSDDVHFHDRLVSSTSKTMM